MDLHQAADFVGVLSACGDAPRRLGRLRRLWGWAHCAPVLLLGGLRAYRKKCHFSVDRGQEKAPTAIPPGL